MSWLSLLVFVLFGLFQREPFVFSFIEFDSPEYATTPPEVQETLQQPFTYLGEGAQVIAFGSEDGQVVLKLFKSAHKKRLTPRRLVRHLFKDKSVSRAKWQEKFRATCACYEIAYQRFRNEAGLLHLHFTPTDSPLFVTLQGKKSYQINLANRPFILQKKALLAPSYFASLETQESRSEAKRALLAFFERRTKLGLSDPRQTMSINYGFVSGQPIQIDCGKLEEFTGDTKAEIQRIHEGVEEWYEKLAL